MQAYVKHPPGSSMRCTQQHPPGRGSSMRCTKQHLPHTTACIYVTHHLLHLSDSLLVGRVWGGGCSPTTSPSSSA